MAIGSAFEAGAGLDISAGGSVLASASMVELDFINYYDKTKSLIGFKTGGSYRSAEWNDWQISRSLISGRDVVVEAGLDLITHGAIFEATAGNVDLTARRDVQILPVSYETYSKIVTKSSGLFSSSKSSKTTKTSTLLATDIASDDDLSLVATKGNITIEAGKMKSGGDITIAALEGQLKILTGRTYDYEELKTESTNPVWWTKEDKGHYVEKLVHTQLICSSHASGMTWQADDQRPLRSLRALLREA